MKQVVNKSKQIFCKRLSPIKLSEIIDYKNINLFRRLISAQGRIIFRQMNRLTLK
jgi:ribosomal protein S18